MNIKDYIETVPFEKERCSVINEWWYITTLIEASKDLVVYDLCLHSIDFDVWPWELKTIFSFLEHTTIMNECSLNYPIMVSPAGWIMNGWHRVAKAVLEGRETIKAIRFTVLPEPDGLVNKET